MPMRVGCCQQADMMVYAARSRPLCFFHVPHFHEDSDAAAAFLDLAAHTRTGRI